MGSTGFAQHGKDIASHIELCWLMDGKLPGWENAGCIPRYLTIDEKSGDEFIQARMTPFLFLSSMAFFR